jgi:MarR family transcriptional regulator, organic hydroperoxide resistance regulator
MVTSADRRLFWLLSLAYRRAAGMADAGLEDLGLTAAQAGALFAIPVDGTASVNDIAATLRIAQSAASAFAQKLEKSGLVSRRANPADSRYALLVLTERGRELRTRALSRAKEFNARLCADLTDEQFAIITGWLLQVINMKEEET